jgi:hypothetical protein
VHDSRRNPPGLFVAFLPKRDKPSDGGGIGHPLADKLADNIRW